MKTKKLLSLSAAMLAALAVRAAAPEAWQDKNVTGLNREAPRATFWYYSSRQEALDPGYYRCSDNISLNGKWRFAFAENPAARPDGFYRPDYDVSQWDVIDVPGSWPLQGYDRPVYLNHPYEFALKTPIRPWRRRCGIPSGRTGASSTSPQRGAGGASSCISGP